MKQINQYRRIALWLMLCLCLAVDTPLTAAQPPERDATWDDRFGRPGLYFASSNYNLETLTLSGNDLYVGGEFDGIGNNVAHWNGRRWQALGEGVDDDVYALVAQGGDLYAGGFFKTAGGVNAGGIARWDGSSWSAVGSGVGVADSSFPIVYALSWLNNALYIGGRFGSIDGLPAASIARWDGNSWLALGEGVSKNQSTAEIHSLLAHNGLLYVGGYFDTAGGIAANNIAIWDGSSWSPLGAGVDSVVYALATDGTNIYAGGEFQTAGGQVVDGVARWDGSTWHPLGSGLQNGSLGGRVRDLTVIGSSLYAVGDFDQAGALAVKGLARWQAGTWSAVGGGIQAGLVAAVVPSEDGGLYVGGDFDSVGPVNDSQLVFNIAKWRDGAWHALGDGPIRDNPLGIGWIPGSTDTMVADDNGNVFLDLSNTYVGGQLIDSGPARWDGQAWSALTAAEIFPTAMAVDGDLVYFSGDFTNLPGIGTAPLAVWDQNSQSWSTLSSQLNGTILALTVDQGILYAAGSFNVPGYNGIKNVAWWDGNQWSASTQMADGQSFEIGNSILALAVAGGRLFVGGTFENLIFPNGVAPINNIVGLDLGSDQWFGLLSAGGVTPGVTFDGDGTSADVRDLAAVGGVLYVGGNFSQAGNLLSNDLAAWDANQGWSTLGGGLGGTGSSWVASLSTDGTNLYVGGKFTAAGPHQVNHLARWDTVARAWSALAGGLGPYDDTHVTAIAVGGDSLYVSGNFTEAGEQPAYGFTRWGPPALVQGSSFISVHEGGRLTTSDGLEITFPAGAVTEDVIVTYQALDAPTHGLPAKQGAIRAFTLTAHTLDGVPVTTFTQPYILTLTYTEAELSTQAVQEANLNLLYWDKGWQAMLPTCTECSIDLITNQLTVIADHFTEFAFVGTQQQVYLPLVIR